MKPSEEKLLEENGWTVECYSPFEIRHYDGSFATMSAAYSVLDELRYESRSSDSIGDMLLIKDAYKANLIDKDAFITKMIEALEEEEE